MRNLARSALVTTVVVLGFLAPASAFAGTITVALDGSTLRLTGDGGNNSIVLSNWDAATPLRIDGGGDTVTAPASCVRDSPTTNVYRCTTTGLTLVSIDGLGGDDYLNSYNFGGTRVELKGGPGVDNLQVGGLNGDIIDGGPGADTISTGGGDDTLNGGDDNDRILGLNGIDTIDGGAGDDQIFTYAGDDIVHGGAGNDQIQAMEGKDKLYGDAGDDSLDGGADADTFDGGADFDVVTYASYGAGVTVTFDGVGNDGLPGEGDNVSTEGVIGSGYGDTLTGGPGNDYIDGYSGDDTIKGGAGDDTLLGSNDNDAIDGEGGADSMDGGYGLDFVSYASRAAAVTVTMDGVANDGVAGEGDNVKTDGVIGTASADTLTGGDATDDSLKGQGGADVIKGLGGNDTIDGGLGADDLDGGAGSNTVDYTGRTEDLTVDLADSALDGATGENDKLANFRGITGGSGNDLLRLAPSSLSEDLPSLLTGRGLIGGAGNDRLYGTEAAERMDGGDGTDALYGYGGPDTMIGGKGNDTLDAGDGSDKVYGDADKGGAYSYSEDGNSDAGDGNDSLLGGDGYDTLVGGGGADTLDGGPANDGLWAGAGADTVAGGPGFDTIDYLQRGAGVNVTLGVTAGDDGNAVDGPAGARDTLAGDIESIIGTNASDTITGTDVDNTLAGRGGDDVLHGGGGNDTLDGGDTGGGGQGADLLDGGPGTDTVIYGPAWWSQAVNVSLDGVANDGMAGERDNVLATERLIGSDQGDTFTGTGADEFFDGGAGNDTINAAGGADVIVGGDGADTIDAGAGNDLISTRLDPRTPTYGSGDYARDVAQGGEGDDMFIAANDADGNTGNTLDGGPGTDTVSYLGEYRPVKISQDGIANDGLGAVTDNVAGFEILRGGSGADTLTGGGGVKELQGAEGVDTLNGGGDGETLLGGDGNDVLNAGGGDDLLDGGTGKDVLNGGEGVDFANYAARFNGVAVTLDGLANDGETGEADNVQTEGVYGGEGDDTLTGAGGADLLRGGNGNDRIDGAAGDDALDGGPGRDTLISGTGSDALDAADGEADTLTCDTRTGKSVLADAGVDALDSCADPATLGSGSGGDPSVFGGLRPGMPLTPRGAPDPGTPLPRPSAVADRDAKLLVKALKLKRSVKLSAKTSAIGIATARCQAARPCTLRVTLRKGKKVVGRGTVAGTGKLTARAWLLAAGRKGLRKSMKVTVEVTISEGGSRATVQGPATIVLKGGR